MLYLLLLLFSACTTTPTTYQRGSLAPASAPVRPGVGAPVYDPPHAPGPRMQSQPPPTRFLPETPGGGPGIWAASDDRHGPPYPAVHLLGIMLETEPDPSELEWDTVALCAVSLQGAGGEEMAILARLPDWPRACAVSHLYVRCVEAVAQEAQRRRESAEEYDETAMAAIRRSVDAAHKQRRLSCRTTLNEGAMEAIDAIMSRWRAHNIR